MVWVNRIVFVFLIFLFFFASTSFMLSHPCPPQVTPEVLVDIAGKIPQGVKDNLWAAIKSGSYHKMAVSQGRIGVEGG